MGQPITIASESASRPILEVGEQQLTQAKLIESCSGLVRSLAWTIHRKMPRSISLEDLVAYGHLGLVEAANNYDPAKGNQFITFAYYRIRGAILDGLKKMSWFSPIHYHAGRYEHVADDVLEVESSNAISPEDIEGQTDWLIRTSRSLSVAYLSSSAWNEEAMQVSSGQETAGKKESEQIVRQMLDALEGDAGLLLRATYLEGLSLTDAAKKVGISKSWASRLHVRTLERLALALKQLGIHSA